MNDEELLPRLKILFPRDFKHAKWYNLHRWMAVKKRVLKRDNRVCQKCKERMSKRRLTVHHIVPVRENKDKWFSMDNLQTMCIPCHEEINFDESKREMFNA